MSGGTNTRFDDWRPADSCCGCEVSMDLLADDAVLWDEEMESGPWHEACLAVSKAPANGSHRPVPETDVPYDEDHPCNDPHF